MKTKNNVIIEIPVTTDIHRASWVLRRIKQITITLDDLTEGKWKPEEIQIRLTTEFPDV